MQANQLAKYNRGEGPGAGSNSFDSYGYKEAFYNGSAYTNSQGHGLGTIEYCGEYCRGESYTQASGHGDSLCQGSGNVSNQDFSPPRQETTRGWRDSAWRSTSY